MKPSQGAQIMLEGLKQFQEGATQLGDILKGRKTAEELKKVGPEFFKGGQAGKEIAMGSARQGDIKGAGSVVETPTEPKLSMEELYTSALTKSIKGDKGSQDFLAFIEPKALNWKSLSKNVSNFKLDFGKEDIETQKIPYSVFGKIDWKGLRSKDPVKRAAATSAAILEYSNNVDRLYPDRPDYQKDTIVATGIGVLKNFEVFSRGANSLDEFEATMKEAGLEPTFTVDNLRVSKEVERAVKEKGMPSPSKKERAINALAESGVITSQQTESSPGKVQSGTKILSGSKDQKSSEQQESEGLPSKLPASQFITGKTSIFKKGK